MTRVWPFRFQRLCACGACTALESAVLPGAGPSMNRENLLMVSDSEHDANMLYAVRMFVPDPFIYLRLNGKCHIVMNDPELHRAREQARHCRILSWGQYVKKLKQKGVKSQSFAAVIREILHEKRIKKVFVPDSFPH